MNTEQAIRLEIGDKYILLNLCEYILEHTREFFISGSNGIIYHDTNTLIVQN